MGPDQRYLEVSEKTTDFHPLLKKLAQFPPEENYLDPDAYVQQLEPPQPVAPTDVQENMNCPHCGSIFPTSRLENDHAVCDNCNYYIELKCDDCDKNLLFGEERKDPWGNEICEECFEGSYVVCVNCEETVKEEDEKKDEDGDSLCEECFYDNYTYCEPCGDAIKIDDAAFVDEDRWMCKECAKDFYCDECMGYKTNTQDRQIGEENKKLCDECFMSMWENGEIATCDQCHAVVTGDNIHYTEDGSECNECYGGNDNIKSYYELKEAAEGNLETQSDLEYYKDMYPNLFSVSEDYNRKKKKSWNYIQKWSGGFDYVPEMDVGVTRPSTDYEGTYIEFDLSVNEGERLAEKIGMDESQMWDVFKRCNDYHPCLVSSDADRMIVSRVLVDDNGDWNVKLMQGSINQEAKAEMSRIEDEIRGEERKCRDCGGGGKSYSWRGGPCKACNGKGVVKIINEEQLEGWDKTRGEEEAEKLYPKEYGGEDPLKGLEERGKDYYLKQDLQQKMEQLDKIVKLTNGAYIAAYDWIKNLAKQKGKKCYVEVPEGQARQHPNAPKISLEVIYGGIPFLMGFEKEKIKRELEGEGEKGVEQKGKSRYRMAKANNWDFEDIADMAIFDPLLR